MHRRRYLVGLGATAAFAGCLGDSGPLRGERRDPDAQSLGGSSVARALTLAVTTTTHDSGLLDVLNPAFEATFDTTVRPVVRGTGAALRTGRDGDCDVVFVHSRPAEDEFIAAGDGINRRDVMVNDFLIVGPPDDPASVAGRGPSAAFERVATTGSRFLSRGDDSGTHDRERRLWTAAGVAPTGSWYRETGQGMGNTLVAADQQGAYTLADRGTFRSLAGRIGLVAHVDTGLDDPHPLLRNEYGAIAVNPARHDVAYPEAMAYLGFLTGPAQSLVDSFRVGGTPVFRPTALSGDPNFEQYVPRS
ncbi:substrate-binding domain-containing protein [Halomarina oriensis]|uniref:Molybdenum transporter n=1 Tax=Halomarina oriensis TaxID=671145 RepID=A0A6B0GR10_9EURY|nr:substrate-binding domain-containing protein [Halomarina oriensis]MWG35797.1 molybdenum transporter [Halomarina oriensis]